MDLINSLNLDLERKVSPVTCSSILNFPQIHAMLTVQNYPNVVWMKSNEGLFKQEGLDMSLILNVLGMTQGNTRPESNTTLWGQPLEEKKT